MFWDLDRNLLQMEILGKPVDLGLVLVNYLHKQSSYLTIGLTS